MAAPRRTHTATLPLPIRVDLPGSGDGKSRRRHRRRRTPMGTHRQPSTCKRRATTAVGGQPRQTNQGGKGPSCERKYTRKTTLTKAAALAAAGCAAALALAGPASAEKYNRHFAQDCPQPYSQNCSPQPSVNVATKGPLFVTFTADGNPPSCAPGKARIFIDGGEWGSAV